MHRTQCLFGIGIIPNRSRPKQAYYNRICLSLIFFSALVSSSCRRPRFAIAAMPSTRTLQAARNKDEAECKYSAGIFKIS